MNMELAYMKKAMEKIKKYLNIVLEICGGGELFDFIAISGAFKENSSKILLQIIYGWTRLLSLLMELLTEISSQRILLLDSNYVLKIADFGFAAPVEGRDGSGYLNN